MAAVMSRIVNGVLSSNRITWTTGKIAVLLLLNQDLI